MLQITLHSVKKNVSFPKLGFYKLMVLGIKYFKTKYLNHLPFARKSFFLILKGFFPLFINRTIIWLVL